MSQARRISHPFVESSENRLGIGKLTKLNSDSGIVEYFRSPADLEPITRVVPKASLKGVVLPYETRAYYRNPVSYTTEVGRILDYQKDDDQYLVRFPNDKLRLLSSDDLQVRCRVPIADPTDHLAYQLNETAFWHEGRSQFVRHLCDQHGANRGLSALISSSVELVPHQASVIHRVLLDPFQRYLLADEVGLGKTIEAGVLVKQFALDEPENHQTLIVVPDSLLVQWQQELTHRFHLGHLLGISIQIVGSRDLNKIAVFCKTARMIVVDEAHHLSSWAWSSDSEERKVFDAVKNCVSKIEQRVLLLSATPVSHNEKSFLAMLHLLDPQVYPLNSLEQFKIRVRLRQEIAECMLSLNENESNFFLDETLDELGELLKDDAEFQSLRGRLQTLLQDVIDESHQERTVLIRSIRTHVNDMWRLHRRILRNRRTETTSAYMPGRGGLKHVTYDSHSERGLEDAIESWRLSLSAVCFGATEPQKAGADSLARMMVEHAACDPGRALEFGQRRLKSASGNLGTTQQQDEVPLFDGEVELLKQIVRAAQDCEHKEKLEALSHCIGSEDSNDSFVIFADHKETADRIFKFLNTRSPTGRMLRHSPSDLSWTQFKSSHRGYVLVCDRRAEEGLNLQKRGASAIHYDLPFAPNRIEQRMGRLDRFGIGTPIQSAALVSSGSRMQEQWCELLNVGLQVFSRSIASLQYVIEESMQQVWREFLDAGSDAFGDAAERLGGDGGTVSKELRRIRAQDDIDSFEADQMTQQVADDLDADDRRLSRTSADVFMNWVVRDMQFRQRGESGRSDAVFSYEFTRRVDTGRRPFGKDTLMPENEFKSRFKDSIDDLPVEKPAWYSTVPMTFDRVIAQKRSTRLLRVGDPFVDALEQFTRWDDRGVSFAFWRYIPDYNPIEDPDVFFRFDYVTSPNLEPFNVLCSQKLGANVNSLIRRSRAIMVPRFITIWLDVNLERVDSPDMLIKAPFQKHSQSAHQDFNLNSDRWQEASKLYDFSLWQDRCFAARKRSEVILRERSKLSDWSNDCIERAKSQAEKVAQQYRTRMAMADGELLRSLGSDLDFERQFLAAQIESFRNPELRVDSVGAIFLSAQMPVTRKERVEKDES